MLPLSLPQTTQIKKDSLSLWIFACYLHRGGVVFVLTGLWHCVSECVCVCVGGGGTWWVDPWREWSAIANSQWWRGVLQRSDHGIMKWTLWGPRVWRALEPLDSGLRLHRKTPRMKVTHTIQRTTKQHKLVLVKAHIFFSPLIGKLALEANPALQRAKPGT